MENNSYPCHGYHPGMIMLNERALCLRIVQAVALTDNPVYRAYLRDQKIVAVKEARSMVDVVIGSYPSLAASKEAIETLFPLWDADPMLRSAYAADRIKREAIQAKAEQFRTTVLNMGGFLSRAEAEALANL